MRSYENPEQKLLGFERQKIDHQLQTENDL